MHRAATLEVAQAQQVRGSHGQPQGLRPYETVFALYYHSTNGKDPSPLAMMKGPFCFIANLCKSPEQPTLRRRNRPVPRCPTRCYPRPGLDYPARPNRSDPHS
jgi:hypothetical protein